MTKRPNQLQREQKKLKLLETKLRTEQVKAALNYLGRPRPRNSYKGGVPTRLDRSWSMGGVNQYGLTLGERTLFTSMRSRARNLEQDNALASGVLDRAVENIIGIGIRIQPRTEDETFNEAALELWNDWSYQCDLRGLRDFGAVQQQMCRSYLMDGDAGCILVDIDGRPFLQLIESDRLSTPDMDLSKENFFDGVECNGIGKPIGFHVLEETENGVRRNWRRIPSRDFVYYPRLRRPHQVRGLTAFSQGFQLFDLIWGYLEATVVAARVGASQALIVKKPNAANAFAQLTTATNSDGVQQANQTIEPGMIHYLPTDGDVTGFDPTQPTSNFPDAIACFARFVGLNFGLTLEQVMLDFSRTTWHSARAARIQAHQTAYQEQCTFYHLFLRRVYQWWISKMVDLGELTNPPEKFWKHEWIPQGKPYVDPAKEIQAGLMAVDAGLETRTNLALEAGYTFKDLVKQNKEDVAAMEAAGLPILNSTLTREPKPEEVEQPEPAPADDEDEEEEDDAVRAYAKAVPIARALHDLIASNGESKE